MAVRFALACSVPMVWLAQLLRVVMQSKVLMSVQPKVLVQSQEHLVRLKQPTQSPIQSPPRQPKPQVCLPPY